MTIATNPVSAVPDPAIAPSDRPAPLADPSSDPSEEDWPDDFPGLPPCDLYSDEPPMETTLHLRQMLLLLVGLEWHWRVGSPAERTDYFAAGNLTIYYSRSRIKTREFRGPDFFVVKDVEPRERRSWTLWEEEGRYPDVIIEILSDCTANVDRTTKKDLYQTTFRTPEYFWFDPDSLEFQGFSLAKRTYQPIVPNPQGWLWSEELNLFLGIHDRRLRYFTAEGELVPTPQESALQEAEQRILAETRAREEAQRANQAEQRAQQEADRAQQEADRAERFAAKLRELNIDPDAL